MPFSRYNLPEHDLTVIVARGKHTSKEVVEQFRALDDACTTRWLEYFGETADMSRIDLAQAPMIRRVKREKRVELFGNNPKFCAIVCDSKAAEQFFFEFWQRYSDGDFNERYFQHLDEAYDWLGLSEAARAAVARAIDGGDAGAAAHRTEAPRPL